MSETYPHYSEYIKQGVFIIIVLAIALFGIKSCRNFQKKKAVTVELSAHASESAAYEQFYKESAQENLLKAMYQMHLGEELGLTPDEIIAKVIDSEKELFASGQEKQIPIRKALIRDALLSNYDNCHKLGIFDIPLNIDALAKGKMPTITKGQTANEEIVISSIISDKILPGVDKLLPNMIISPPRTKKTLDQETHFERARAKLLAESLSNAELIENDAYKKVVHAYDQLNEPKKEIEPKPKK